MSDRKRIKVGDIVVLNKPVQPVKRVGYSLHWTEVDWSKDSELLEVGKFCEKNRIHTRQLNRIYEALAREYVERNGFGGKERTVIRDTDSEMLMRPGRYEVIAKRVKYIGRYSPGSGPSVSSWGYDCPDPAYLADAKAVILLDVVEIDSEAAFLCRGEITADDCVLEEVKA
jgi:hypothetical protein